MRAFRFDLREERVEFLTWRCLGDAFDGLVEDLSILRVTQNLLTLPQQFQRVLVPRRTELEQVPQLLDTDPQRMRTPREVDTGGMVYGLDDLVGPLSGALGKDAFQTGNLDRHQGWQFTERQRVDLSHQLAPRRCALAQQVSTAHCGPRRCRRHPPLEIRQEFQRDVDVPDSPKCAGDAANYLGCLIKVRLRTVAGEEVQRSADPSRRDPGIVNGFRCTVAHGRHQSYQTLCIVR